MQKFIFVAVASLGLAVGLCPMIGQNVISTTAGITAITFPGNSDTIVGIPFARPTVFTGQVQSATTTQVVFKGTPNWATNQFVFTAGSQSNNYYLLITSGAKAGAWYTITANTASSLTLELEGDNLSDVSASDGLSIIPYWTLKTLFSNGQGILTSTSPGNRLTEVFLPNYSDTGINASMARTFYFYNNTWLEVGQGVANRDNEIIYPDSFFTVRHNTATGTKWMANGSVISGSLRTTLAANSAGKRDNYIGIQRPLEFSLAESGLIVSGAFATSPSPGNRTDELYVYDNIAALKNKSPSATYYYWNGAWRKVGAGATIFNDTKVFQPGVGFVIRKNPAATSAVWSNTPNY